MQELENNSYKLPKNIIATIPNCLTKEQCQKLIKYHQTNFNLVTHDDAAEQYNGRRIPMVSIRNIHVKRILAEYQYKAIAEIWKVYGEMAYPEQTEIMWWPQGKGQEMHIDVMAKPLYEVPIDARKGTELEHMTNEDDVEPMPPAVVETPVAVTVKFNHPGSSAIPEKFPSLNRNHSGIPAETSQESIGPLYDETLISIESPTV